MPLKGRALTWWTEYETFRKEEGKFLSISVHPSYVSAAMTLLAAGDEEEAWPGFLGRVTDASVRTLTYAIQCLSLIVFLSRLPFGDERFRLSVGLTFDRKKKLHRQLEARRYVLVRILHFLGSRRSERGVFEVEEPARLKEWALEELTSSANSHRQVRARKPVTVSPYRAAENGRCRSDKRFYRCTFSPEARNHTMSALSVKRTLAEYIRISAQC